MAHPRCLIKGHDHELKLDHVKTQKGTGIKAYVYECPTGAYRFWSVDGKPISRALMFKRPRWGWPKVPDTEIREAQLIAAEQLEMLHNLKKGE